MADGGLEGIPSASHIDLMNRFSIASQSVNANRNHGSLGWNGWQMESVQAQSVLLPFSLIFRLFPPYLLQFHQSANVQNEADLAIA